MNLSLMVYALAVGMGNDIGIVECLVLFPPVLLVQTLPISIAGWGVREGAMVTLFAFAGVSADSALALSLLFGVAIAVTSLPGAILWVLSGKRTVADGDTA
ncbi:MAG: flippase-like domain-containing protein [Alphaproteobacteria bacterium]|nr:flippase-like domain-containing protein [Alphaproteobacteria bacterium]